MEHVHYYDTCIRWEADRKGTARSSVLDQSIEVATPPEFAKGMPGIWSPEHLFVAAVNSCLMTTFLAVAENFKLGFSHFESQAKGKLEIVDKKFMMSEVVLRPIVHVASEADVEKAMKVLHKSEAACLISNSIKSTIVFEPEVLVQTALESEVVELQS